MGVAKSWQQAQSCGPVAGEGVSAVGPRTVTFAGGAMIIVEWGLNTTPDPRWVASLASSGLPAGVEVRVWANRLQAAVPADQADRAADAVERAFVVANEIHEAQLAARRESEEAARRLYEADLMRLLAGSIGHRIGLP